MRTLPWRCAFSACVLGLAAAACIEPPVTVVEPLRVINWSPASGAVCVDASAQILVTFSDDIDTETLTGASLQVVDADGPVDATIGYDKTTYTATLTPSSDLTLETLYTVEATTEVTGTQQGPLPADVRSVFETVGRFGCTP